MSLSAGRIDNGAAGGTQQGLEGLDVNLNAAVLSNVAGAIRVDHDARIVSASLAIANTGGTLIAGQNAVVQAASLTGDGRLHSLDGLTLEPSGSSSRK